MFTSNPQNNEYNWPRTPNFCKQPEFQYMNKLQPIMIKETRKIKKKKLPKDVTGTICYIWDFNNQFRVKDNNKSKVTDISYAIFLLMLVIAKVRPLSKRTLIYDSNKMMPLLLSNGIFSKTSQNIEVLTPNDTASVHHKPQWQLFSELQWQQIPKRFHPHQATT